jgi:hypothetical protein
MSWRNERGHDPRSDQQRDGHATDVKIRLGGATWIGNARIASLRPLIGDEVLPQAAYVQQR